jgi:Tol biopolymer transport system component
MTTFERFERSIPELMTELAPARVPDYFDDMLRQTEGATQRPAWSFPERWLPVEITARPLSMRSFPWRPVLVLALVVALIAAGLALYAGSQHRLPPPFGVARNGQIAFGSSNGDIMRFDPTTGQTAPLIAGPTRDRSPWFSNDGQRFAFDRQSGAGTWATFIADSDGSHPRQVLPAGAPISQFEWSPTGDRFVIQREGDARRLTFVETATGATSDVQLPMEVGSVMWRPGTEQLVVTADARGGVGYFLVNVDGTGWRPVEDSGKAVNPPSISPDGSKLAFTTWQTGAEGRLHIVDIDSLQDSGVDFDPGYPYTDLQPLFSPDGKSVALERYPDDTYQLTIVPIDGTSPTVPLGEAHPQMTNGALKVFSPDGTRLLVTFQNDATIWSYDVSTGNGERMTWSKPKDDVGTWQRLAP